jgi:hypothetical protein
MSAPRVFLVNVGANTADALRSPLYPDGTFDFVTIAEGEVGDDLPTYGDLRAVDGTPLLDRYPPALRARFARVATHADPWLRPDLRQFSYGDVPDVNPRARAISAARPGDLLVFVANLSPYDPVRRRFTGPGAFHAVGCIEVGQVLAHQPGDDHLTEVGPNAGRRYPLAAFGHNAHVRRVGARGPHQTKPFLVFEGGPRSVRPDRPPPIDAELADACLRDRTGQPFDRARFPTFASCFGSYTRTVRVHYDLADPSHRALFAVLAARLGDALPVLAAVAAAHPAAQAGAPGARAVSDVPIGAPARPAGRRSRRAPRRERDQADARAQHPGA